MNATAPATARSAIVAGKNIATLGGTGESVASHMTGKCATR